MLVNLYLNQLHSEKFIYKFFFLECPHFRKLPCSLLVQVILKLYFKFAYTPRNINVSWFNDAELLRKVFPQVLMV